MEKFLSGVKAAEIDFWPKDSGKNFANKQRDVADNLCDVWENRNLGKSLWDDKALARSPASKGSP